MIELVQIYLELIGSFIGALIGFIGAIIGAVLAVVGTYYVTRESMNKQIKKMNEQIQFDKDNASLEYLPIIEVVPDEVTPNFDTGEFSIEVKVINKTNHPIFNLLLISKGREASGETISTVLFPGVNGAVITATLSNDIMESMTKKKSPVFYLFALSKNKKIISINTYMMSKEDKYNGTDVSLYIRADSARFGQSIYKSSHDLVTLDIPLRKYKEYLDSQ